MNLEPSKEELVEGDYDKEDISKLKDQFGLSAIRRAEFSRLFILQLFIGSKERIINCFQVVDEVKAIEGFGKSSYTKPATQFDNLPLKGFWHKHYYQPRFLYTNLIQHWELKIRNLRKFSNMVERTFDKLGEEHLNFKVASKLANEISSIGFMEKNSSCTVTGEWIIFQKYQGKNYYLTLASHKEKKSRKENDYCIFNRMERSCSFEFPFLFQRHNKPLTDERNLLSHPSSSAKQNGVRQ